MNGLGQTERTTQNRVVRLFEDELGYTYLGNWEDRYVNSNIDPELLTQSLEKRGYSPEQISRAIDLLKKEADNRTRNLYQNNKAVYSLLRYGIQIQTRAGEPTKTVHLIDWVHPEKNEFGIAEEVTVFGHREKRPDIVLYINGIAVVVLELKNSRVSVADGIRQNLVNQQPEFIEPFFTTVQLVLAGNDSEGLRYGAVKTEEKYFLKWKEDPHDTTHGLLDKYLDRMCRKERLLELIHDFVVFDGGEKKLPRAHQYFGIKAAQEFVHRREGGIIWHTQGSGKSIVMVLLAKWILENNPKARVAIITDREALDKQIEGVFREAGEDIYRTSSGYDLIRQLSKPEQRLLCSLVHKFGRRGVDDFEAFIKEIEQQHSQVAGEVFVFVDECHRTQSGKLHRTMKALMPNAVFIGFTGTPLLAKDRASSLEVFGNYIHTYKFDEAVEDEVVLDLVYEARDIDQELGSQEKVDQWFDAKTRGLNDWQKAALKEKWGNMQTVLSSRSRMDRLVMDVVHDFNVKPRLSNHRGTAMLVASSIFEACRYYELFQKTVLKGKCAIVTSYDPHTRDVTTEETGAGSETDKQVIFNLYTEILKDVEPKAGKSKTETYEDWAKEMFKKEPANMKLLIVVDKLLTGFDAPSCTYLYIDKSMQDHGLFQAICRTNRLDGSDKEYGYIVDYKDLFNKMENAIAVYTSELHHIEGDEADPEILIKDRLTKGRDRLETAREAIFLLCEPVEPPYGDQEYIRYFCGNTEIPEDLQANEPKRIAFYKSAAALVRAYAAIADELERAGYTPAESDAIKREVNGYVKVRETIRMASGETIDLKAYEADMRHLIDTYIEAKDPRTISPFDGMPLIDVIVKSGIAEAISSQLGGLKGNRNAIAETIENNVRKKIIKERLTDPAFYDRMSKLLDEIIKERKSRAIEYKEYLKRVAELAKVVQAGESEETPQAADTPGKRAIYNNLKSILQPEMEADTGAPDNQPDSVLEMTLKIDRAVKTRRPDDWRGNQPKENVVKQALFDVLNNDDQVERIFQVVVRNREY